MNSLSRLTLFIVTIILVLPGYVLANNQTSQHTPEFKFIGNDNSIYTRICISAALDNVSKLNQNVRISNNSMRTIAKNVTCNNQNIADFAWQFGAQKTTKKLYRYQPRGKVSIENIAKTPSREVTIIYIGGVAK